MRRVSSTEQARLRAGVWALENGHGSVTAAATEVDGTFVARLLTPAGQVTPGGPHLLVDRDGTVTAYPAGAPAGRLVSIHQARLERRLAASRVALRLR